MKPLTLLFALLTLVFSSTGCEKEIPFNPQIHRAEAISEDQPWTATAQASFSSVPPNDQLGADVDEYLTIRLLHTYPNQIDQEHLNLFFPHGVTSGCHNIDLRSHFLFLGKLRGQTTYFQLIGSELDAVRELYSPDTARLETSTICITKFSEREQLVEGTFDLYFKTSDDFAQPDDANRPDEFSIQNGTFSAHLAE